MSARAAITRITRPPRKGATPRAVTFTVVGDPAPKGSTRAFVPFSWAREAVRAGRAPRAVITRANPRAKDWEHRIATEAAQALPGWLFVGPVIVSVTFRMLRPPSVRRGHHTVKPDIDKLSRCVLDALSGVLFADDAQVIELHVRKVYAVSPAPPAARITVALAAPPDPAQLDLRMDGSSFA